MTILMYHLYLQTQHNMKCKQLITKLKITIQVHFTHHDYLISKMYTNKITNNKMAIIIVVAATTNVLVITNRMVKCTRRKY